MKDTIDLAITLTNIRFDPEPFFDKQVEAYALIGELVRYLGRPFLSDAERLHAREQLTALATIIHELGEIPLAIGALKVKGKEHA